MNSVIVIPTYNEKDNIQPLVEEIFKVAPDVGILIVDDNSIDGTGRIADELSKKYAQVEVLHREKKEGLGRAYIAGFKEALKINPDYILQKEIPIIFYTRSSGLSKKSKAIIFEALFKTLLFRLL